MVRDSPFGFGPNVHFWLKPLKNAVVAVKDTVDGLLKESKDVFSHAEQAMKDTAAAPKQVADKVKEESQKLLADANKRVEDAKKNPDKLIFSSSGLVCFGMAAPPVLLSQAQCRPRPSTFAT